VETASIKEGDVVVDLGSGGGFDVFKASKLVGASGRVIGVDATPEMILRARETAHRHAYSNVEFRLGEIEHLPVDSSSVDLVISNCVINLAPDKSVVFREAYRVLKPGGRLVVSDMVTDGAVKIKQEDLNKWAECVAGALPENEYLAKIKAAGFADVDLRPESEAQGCCSTGIASVTVTATKPKTS
jgi:ubiquinone/menaquinone biosynthesis C-methylase UbiE